jgi:hypothetical protein
MTTRALTIDDIARIRGRGREWVSDHWRRLVKEGKLPPPIEQSATGSPTWDAAQVFAVMDKHLPAAVRANAAAIRAAYDAAHGAPGDAIYDDELAEQKAKLDRRFSGTSKQREQA